MIGDAVDRYVALIRAGGASYRSESRYLAKYAAFALTRGETHVRIQTVLEWTRRVSSARQRRRLLLIVRRFALSAAVEDGRHEVPPVDLLPRVPRVRYKPYIYSPAEIASLLAVSDECAPVRCAVPGQYRVLFGLIAATGLRHGEALAINVGDITPEGLMVRPMKRAGWRLLPLHSTVETKLAQHLRKRLRVPVDTEALFVGNRGARLDQDTSGYVFHRMRARTGLAGKAHGGRNPRVHDLRHTFAVRSLETCGSDAPAIDRHMLALSAWLGHGSVANTYCYHEGTAKLLEQIAKRTEAFHREDAS
ncbi:MAG: tyrosine-type recombinase/integrase [Acidimicrobiia bacterium]|nr:tyrosine-type recombinase/integrase [Acidimicrobiia bacterium]